MRKYFLILLSILLFVSSSLAVFATDGVENEIIPENNPPIEYTVESNESNEEIILEDDLSETGSDVSSDPVEDITVNEYILDFPDSIGTYSLNEDDYNAPDVVPYALNNNVYAGSYNSTILSIWNGMIQNNVGKDYVAYRSSQYVYYIFFGENFEYSNNRFSGTGDYYSLNTQSNTYDFTKGYDSFSVNVSNGYLYTNVTGDYPALDNDRGLIYEQIQTIILIALLSFNVLRWIFINK